MKNRMVVSCAAPDWQSELADLRPGSSKENRRRAENGYPGSFINGSGNV